MVIFKNESEVVFTNGMVNLPYQRTSPMKYLLTITISSALLLAACSQKPTKVDWAEEETAIRTVLQDQVKAWNEGSLEEFMEGYWRSDSLLFIGSKITNGWDSTLARYQKSYPTPEARGTLRFEILRVHFTSAEACVITGKYFLTRVNDTPSGVFTLLFRKKEGKWVIVYDHTS